MEEGRAVGQRQSVPAPDTGEFRGNAGEHKGPGWSSYSPQQGSLCFSTLPTTAPRLSVASSLIRLVCPPVFLLCDIAAGILRGTPAQTQDPIAWLAGDDGDEASMHASPSEQASGRTSARAPWAARSQAVARWASQT